jgi:penicillin-binding protein 1C
VDRNGELLYEARQQDFGVQSMLSFHDIPPQAIDALIATEDRTFFRHHGISVRGIARAVVQNLSTGKVVSGGSTITQQLVRIRLRPTRRTVLYKIREMWLALKVDAWLSKEEILEQYLSSVYFGHQAYGFRSAAQVMLGKEPRELSLGETALLIGLIQSPVGLDPFHSMDGAIARRGLVLRAMVETGVITEEQASTSQQEAITLAPDQTDIRAAHFAFWILGQSQAHAGETLQTTLDGDLQADVQDIVERKLEELKEKNATSSAVLVLDAHTGDILAMVGSRNYFDVLHDGAVNVALSARQPGSSLKPFTYALALSHGDTAATTVADTEVQLLTEEGNPYTPRNYDYDLHGLVRYREALANSYNIPAVKVLEKIGVETLLDFLRSAGITTLTRKPEFYGLALTLGSGEVRLLELTEAYGIFPRGGTTLHARGLLNDPIVEEKRILDPRVAWIISDILSDPTARLAEFGENSPLAVPPHKVAAKTGTTRNARDNWVIGYTVDRIVGVWVGNADNTPMKGTSGVTGAGPIFHDVMEAALNDLPPKAFPMPEGIVQRTICTLSGKLPTAECPHTLEEYFVEGTEPQEPDDIYRTAKIDRRNGLLAGERCAAEFVTDKRFTVFPPEVRPWAREHGYQEPPAQYSPFCVGNDPPVASEEDLVITRPHDGDSFRLDPLIPDEHEKIILEARGPAGIDIAEWYVDGVSIGKASGPDFHMEWKQVPGSHSVEIRNSSKSYRINFSVMKY